MLTSTSSFSQIVISQVYGGGGNSGATYTNDFIEIFNRGTSSINITGWSVQYASATGTFWTKTDLTGTLAPGQYYLIQQGAGAGGTTPLPTPDASGNIAMSGIAGKVALVNTTTLLSGSGCPFGSSIVDFVGYGSTATCSEGGTPTPAPSNINAVLRAANGCTDNNNNGTDFTAGAPNPRNTSSPLNPCSGPPPSLTVSVNSGTDAAEPATSGTFNITLSAAAPAGGITVTYNFSTGAGFAVLGIGFNNTPQNGTVTIATGNTSAVVTVNVIDDLDVEGTETIQINLLTATSPATITTGSASINLLDNEVAVNTNISLVNIYTQDFNTLAIVGTSSDVPNGWLFSETGSNANNLYAAGTGSGNGGDTYSFGAASNVDRAFGTLQSGSLTSTIGAQIQNNSGNTITKLKISYTGEQWRLGTASRTDKLSFQYSLDATSLSNGTWINVTNLDFITPNTTTTGAKNGNDPANQALLLHTIRNLSIPNGAAFLIRWEEFNAAGSDDGLAVDDFFIEANPVDITPPVLVSVNPANGSTNISLTTTAFAVFDEDIQKGTGNILVRRNSDNSIFQTIDVTTSTVNVAGATMSVTLNSLEANTGYYIEIAAGAIQDLEGNNFTGIAGNTTWSFTTGINIFVANFQTCISGLGDGFTEFSETGAIVWACTTFGRDPLAPTGTAAYPSAVQINGFAGGTNVPNVDWLISPSFDLTGTTYPLLSFWSRTAFNGLPLQLKVSTDYVSGNPALSTWTDINGRFPSQTSNTWTLSENINLTSFKQTNVHFAFVYFSDDDEGARWTLDDISLANSPVPPPPSLTVSTTDIQFAFTASGNTSDKSFTFIGNDLTNDVTLNATGLFTLSKDGISFGSSLTYTIAEANNISKTVFVRFAPNQNNQNFTGSVSITTGSLMANVNLAGTSIDPVTTLEVVNWNIEWFGSTVNGPTNDAQQEQNVITILQSLNADVYALTEVVSESRLASVVSQMQDYSYVISNYGSHTNTSANPPSALAEAQKMAFIYKTTLLSNITTSALLTQGINSAADLTNPAYNYWASGRFPFMLSADVTLNCVTKNLKFVLVHGKANTSPTATSYDRRKRGADTLHYTLQQNYTNDNVIVLGDFNDDLDQSITAGFTTTSWSAFTTDAVNFEPLTLPLSLAGKKSTVSFNDVIDHVVVSNDMEPYYLDATASILTDVSSLVINYASTTSDHYPVFTRYRFNNTTAPSVISCTTQSTFCASTSNSYTIPAFVATDDCGDVISYSYVISGATVRTGSSNDASGMFNIGTSIINWTATDSWGNTATCQTTVVVNPTPSVVIPDAFALLNGTLANTVYIGYAPASTITLSSTVSGGTPAYSYVWSSGSTNSTTTVSPTSTTTYTLTVTDANNCQATASKTINVIDIRGGHKLDKVIVCHNLNSLVVSDNAVIAHLNHGDMLGGCPLITNRRSSSETVSEEKTESKLGVKVLSNPTTSQFTLIVSTDNAIEKIGLRVTDILGRTVEQNNNLTPYESQIIGNGYGKGIYFVEITQGNQRVTSKLIKQ